MNNIKAINSLLKDELAAVETYQQMFEKLREDASLGETESLLPIYENHKTAVTSLQALIRQSGGTPAVTSGVWGAWSKLIEGGAKLLGKVSALEALRVGEKIGEEEYERALKDTELPADLFSLIMSTLLPAQKSHTHTLNRLLV
ncbi:DUF2383 domain-containing protein [Methylomonas paludis]|jgi:hypothetical protein|uniref:DUF2383 domain-containing protein n=1 Tax=Methylomonas paludis TaxID=1173101 RepID=A0A975MRI9_9GAMM|nr:DUF2383 domain-containing protein [Methylomonas paludis]QWF72189.1 DUF2383 domain-containing protein [Methylomonas paludis]